MDAAVVKRLEQLSQLNKGHLTPQAVVDDARTPTSPLHAYFEWNDDVAAEKYRVEQARTLIRKVKVEIVVEEVQMTVPKYVHNPDLASGEAGYVETVRLRSDRSRAREALANEIGRVVNALKRAEAVAAVLGLQGEVEELQGRVEQLLAQLAA